MDLDSCIILEFCNVCQPFLIRRLCREFSVQNIFCDELGICRLSGAAIVGILDCGFDTFLPTDSKYPLVVCLDAVISVQIITYSPVPLIRAFHVDLFNLISDFFIFHLISRSVSMEPFIVSRPRYMTEFTKRSNRITMLFVFFFDRLIDMPIPDQA